MKNLMSKLLLVIFLIFTQNAHANPQWVAVKVDVYSNHFDKSKDLIKAINTAKLITQPRFVTKNDASAVIKIGSENIEMLSMEIKPNIATSNYDANLNLGIKSDDGKWQETTTSSVANAFEKPFLLTSELGKRLYISHVNANSFLSNDEAQAWLEKQ